jgi:hypothetical protein
VYLASVALALTAIGLVILARGTPVGAVPLITGIGALAGWFPFSWSSSALPIPERESVGSWNPVSLGLPLIGTTTALVAATRLIPAGFAQSAAVSEPVLFLAAALSLLIASARLISWHRISDCSLALTGMAACGIAADVALRQGTSTLPVSIVRGDVAGLAVWLHGTAVSVLLSSLSTDSESGSLRGQRAKVWFASLLAADIAGVPPLPGCWLRSNLLFSLVSRQTASSITGEFEPQTGMLMLATLVAIAWGAMMAAALFAFIRADAAERAT